MSTTKKRGHYINTPHKTIEEIAIMARQRVRQGEQACDVLIDLIDGYSFGYMSANYWFLKEEMKKETEDMSTKHTQGPWTINSYQASTDTVNHAILGRANDDKRTVTIATVYPITDEGQPWSESGLNARLIAAAPELLAALESILSISKAGVIHRNETGKPQWSALDEITKLVDMAIAKAKGE